MTRIAVLGGTGELGFAIARRWARAGHEILIGSRSAKKGADAATRLRAEFPQIQVYVEGASLTDAAQSADLIALTVPYDSHIETLETIRLYTAGKIIIDTTVPLHPPKVGTVQLPAVGSAAVEAQQILSEATIVSALQTVSAEKLGHDGPVDCDVFVAADKKEAAETVIALMGDLGLRAWHVGPLANSAAAEALTSVLIQINRRYFSHAGIRVTGDLRGDTAEAAAYCRPISIEPLHGLPLFKTGDDLATMIGDAIVANGLTLVDGDVVVVAQKIVSKAEGRIVHLSDVIPSLKAKTVAGETGKHPALVELILSESEDVIRQRENLIIVRHKTGHVAANAGIDASNVAPVSKDESVTLWPINPDASATRLRTQLQQRFHVRIAVIISDSLGRAWRIGTTGTAIGISGMKPVLDRRGEMDLMGRILQATEVGRADEIAAAASLAIGEGNEGTPVAIVRGARYNADEEAGIHSLLRPVNEDLFL